MKKTIFLFLFMLLALSGCVQAEKKDQAANKIMGQEEARAMAEKYLNDNYGRAGYPALTIASIEDTGSVYKLVVNIPNGTLESYLSRDGKYFFLEGDDLTGGKADKPKIELFVMSHCPYGTQIEKGILPVIEKLGDKVEFDLKFCGYAMHGEAELSEQLTQHCIQKEEQAKLIPYLKCFLGSQNSSACQSEVKVDTEKIGKCVSETDKQYKVKELFADQSTWYSGKYPKFDVDGEAVAKYSVSGSPTLIINGKQVNSGRRDPQGLLAAVCNTFEEAPAECQEALSETTPSAGFGYSEGAAGAAGSCN